jgi:hypothetical protein
MVSFIPCLLYHQGKNPLVPMYRRVGELQSQSDVVVQRKIPASARNQTLIIQPIT